MCATTCTWLPEATPPHCPHTFTNPLTPTHTPVSDDPSHLSLVLDEEQGYYILGPQEAGPRDLGQLDIFIVSLMLSGVKDLLQVCGVRGVGGSGEG